MSDSIDVSPQDVFNWFKRPKNSPEINSGEEIVEKDGYIPADVQIGNMINAGIRLGEYRREKYDYSYDEEVPDDALDPRAFTDPVDAQRALDYVNGKIKAQAKAAEEAAKVVEPPAAKVVEPPREE